MTPATVVLDASVLYSRVLHELFGRLAVDGELFGITWSDDLLAETKRVLIERKPLDTDAAERWISFLRDAFPEGRVELSNPHDRVDPASLTSDPDDEHVCALALAVAPSTLVSLDQGFDAAALAVVGVTLAPPDALLISTHEEHADVVAEVVERQARAWGGRPVDDLLAAFERAGVPRFAERLRGSHPSIVAP